MINQVQNYQFKLMKLTSFNDFDGEAVVNDLVNYHELWQGVIMDRGSYGNEEIDFLKLRDIGDNYWSVDTVFILSTGKDDDKLELLAKTWNADEVNWVRNEDTGGAFNGDTPMVLRVWWD